MSGNLFTSLIIFTLLLLIIILFLIRNDKVYKARIKLAKKVYDYCSKYATTSKEVQDKYHRLEKYSYDYMLFHFWIPIWKLEKETEKHINLKPPKGGKTNGKTKSKNNG